MSRRAERRSRDARNFESEAAGYSSRRLGYEETIDLFLQQQGLADPLAYDRAARIRMNSPRNRGDEQKAWAMQEKRLAMYDFSTRASRGDDASSVTLPEGVSLHSEGRARRHHMISAPGGATLPRVPSTPGPRPPPRPRPRLRSRMISASKAPPHHTISAPGAATLPRVPSTPRPRPPPCHRPPLHPHTISAPSVPVCSQSSCHTP